MYVNAKNLTYFDSFVVEHIPKDIKKIIWSKNIKTNIYRIQAYNSIMWGYFCIGFFLKGKNLPDYTTLFSPNGYKKNDKIILKYIQKIIFVNCSKYRKFKKPKISYLLKKC